MNIYKAVADYRSADNRRLTIGRLLINTKKIILLSYLSYLLRLRLLSEDSYLLERLQTNGVFSFYSRKAMLAQYLPSSYVCLTDTSQVFYQDG